jgi:hypothetical protein
MAGALLREPVASQHCDALQPYEPETIREMSLVLGERLRDVSAAADNDRRHTLVAQKIIELRHMVPLCVQYLQNTTLWDYSSANGSTGPMRPRPRFLACHGGSIGARNRILPARRTPVNIAAQNWVEKSGI